MSRIKMSESDWQAVREKIKETARESMKETSVRKIRISDLCGAAGIATSSFYKLYDTKELLFLDILEDIHTDIVTLSQEVIREKVDLPAVERMTEAFWVMLTYYEQQNLLRFIGEDVQYILTKVPEEYQDNHYLGHEKLMQDILEGSGIEIKVPEKMVYSLIHLLVGTIFFKEQAGDMYRPALRVLVSSACEFVLNGPKQ